MSLTRLTCLTFSTCLALATISPAQGPAQGPAASDSNLPPDPSTTLTQPADRPLRTPGYRPFRSIIIQAKIGSGGAGFEFATPLNRFLALRAGAQFFDDIIQIKANGIHIDGDITLQNVSTSLDIFPFRHSSFRLSPGLTLHNDNHIAGPLSIPANQPFSLGDANYTSDPNAPVLGQARLKFGNSIAPRFTLGYANLAPVSTGRISFPFEVGFEYVSPPVISLYLTGNACDNTGCGPIDQTAVQNEVQQLQSDLTPFRLFPILSLGIAYKFGH